MPEFYLSVLDASFTSIKATLESKKYTIPDFSNSVYVNISQSDIRSIFLYDSSNVITHINDLSADDLRYYVNGTKWPASNSGAVISDASLNENSNLNLKSDFISYLAKQLFNTERGVDLFNNEDALLSDFKSKCNTFWNDLSSNYIYKIDKSSGTHTDLTTDGNNRKYLTNNTATLANLTRELLLQVIDASNTRFSNIDNDLVDGLYAIPFIVGDKVTFILTVHSDSTQTSIIGAATPSAVYRRIYKISLNVTA